MAASGGAQRVRIGVDVVGEVWRVVTWEVPKRKTFHCGECFCCGWMTFEHDHARDAVAAVEAHVRARHRDDSADVFRDKSGEVIQPGFGVDGGGERSEATWSG
jgi:hypothetical protein